MRVTDTAIRDLASSLGVAVTWNDFAGRPRTVSDDALRRILAALGFACETEGELAGSREAVRALAAEQRRPPLVTASVGKDIALRLPDQVGEPRGELVLEDGTRRDVSLRQDHRGNWLVPAVGDPGYHRLHLAGTEIVLAVAPPRCVTVDDIAPGERLWGFAAQTYGLRRPGDGGIGEAGCIAALGVAAAQNGADALALSPSHALFTADSTRYSPYAPSSRLVFNPLHGDARAVFGNERVAAAIREAGLDDEWRARDAASLVDWARSARAKLALLRHLFESFVSHDVARRNALADDFEQFRAGGGRLLQEHARFEAIHAQRLAADPKRWSWRDWPSEWQDAKGPRVEAFAAEHAREVMFHVFLQWVADRSFAAAHEAMRNAGARIGLISDLAVGMDANGSHAWSRPQDILVGLNVGAPPDLFNPRGQNWGITTFSPQALTGNAFAPFLATLRTALRYAGGVRIDHVMGLTRLWLVPDGAGAADGAYVHYPLDDLLRLIALESHRHRAVVIGEDLGTVPEGFRERLAASDIAGMRVLWFERDEQGFTPPQAWPADAVAMTTTHDLPTVAGWWCGADIELRSRHGVFTDADAAASEERARETDRGALWRAFLDANVATGEPPLPNEPARTIEAAVGFIAKTPCRLTLLPLEDAIGLVEQPNLPGTIDQHPNWRRRYALPADTMLDAPDVQARLRPLKAGRHQ